MQKPFPSYAHAFAASFATSLENFHISSKQKLRGNNCLYKVLW